ncbi:Xylanase inhibitor C-terminal [Arabidopsis thaliana x Arabidopsis arenosa]|uniref:Xylanase inhibitor C-terminal n=1 Tax=Arabidopsis thaliana x Arabidopsis arenosa TaxID=1240361 RepID=A0A8T1YXL7_9BRAS|nr:Xylanase inhibitor C-terminal [Arabidopsis thaliana x Arabidopsis arenosa]
MAPRVIFLLFSLVFLYLANTSHSLAKFQSFLHPIYKDKSTNIYSIPLSIGSSTSSEEFVLDLNGAAPLLQNCATAAKSTTYHPIKCGSTRCKYANPNFPCPNNVITKKRTVCRSSDNARLFRDTVPLLYTFNGVYTMDSEKSSSLTLTCSDGAPTLKQRTVGLANTHLSIPSQLISMYKLPQKMALCLPSTEGDKSGEYLIDVKSIQIGGKTVPILYGTTKISTLAPYTVLQTSIYKALLTAFTENAKIAIAPAVKPFGACFHSNGGRGEPVIDLMLRGGAKWRIYGSNSLVKVNKNVVCLGFVDGGVKPKNPIVIGGFQMEDNLVEFDLEASKFSFSSSLLLHNTSCSVARLSPF